VTKLVTLNGVYNGLYFALFPRNRYLWVKEITLMWVIYFVIYSNSVHDGQIIVYTLSQQVSNHFLQLGIFNCKLLAEAQTDNYVLQFIVILRRYW